MAGWPGNDMPWSVASPAFKAGISASRASRSSAVSAVLVRSANTVRTVRERSERRLCSALNRWVDASATEAMRVAVLTRCQESHAPKARMITKLVHRTKMTDFRSALIETRLSMFCPQKLRGSSLRLF